MYNVLSLLDLCLNIWKLKCKYEMIKITGTHGWLVDMEKDTSNVLIIIFT